MPDRAGDGNLSTSAAFDQRLKRLDETRWLASRYALDGARTVLVALYCLNLELHRALGAAEPMLGKIRLQWWREALEEIAEGRTVRRHDLVLELDTRLRGRPLLLAAAFDLCDRYDDALDDRLDSGAQPELRAARIRAIGASLARAAGRALASAVSAESETRLSVCGAAEMALLAGDAPAEDLKSQARAAIAKLDPALVPAVAHLAATSPPNGRQFGPLARRWQIFITVLTRRL